jgi:hypothetical protein
MLKLGKIFMSCFINNVSDFLVIEAEEGTYWLGDEKGIGYKPHLHDCWEGGFCSPESAMDASLALLLEFMGWHRCFITVPVWAIVHIRYGYLPTTVISAIKDHVLSRLKIRDRFNSFVRKTLHVQPRMFRGNCEWKAYKYSMLHGKQG